MFSSGVIKLTNKDAKWKNVTALDYHFFPGVTQVIAACLLVFLQILILVRGNFAFLNLITLGLCLSIVPDNFCLFQSSAILPTGLSPLAASLLEVFFLSAHIFWIYKTLFEKRKWGDFLLPYMRFIYPWRLSNPYGLFAMMTKSRPELILEGSMDGKSWQDYEFNFKPGNVHKAPPNHRAFPTTY